MVQARRYILTITRMPRVFRYIELTLQGPGQHQAQHLPRTALAGWVPTWRRQTWSGPGVDDDCLGPEHGARLGATSTGPSR